MRRNKILLVDDEEACLFSVKLMLESLGLSVILARTGQEAITMLEKSYADISIIFLDMMLPDYTGLEVLIEITKDSEYSKIPVVIQTGMSESDSSLKEARKIGVAGVLRKPYSLGEVEKQIDLLINQ